MCPSSPVTMSRFAVCNARQCLHTSLKCTPNRPSAFHMVMSMLGVNATSGAVSRRQIRCFQPGSSVSMFRDALLHWEAPLRSLKIKHSFFFSLAAIACHETNSTNYFCRKAAKDKCNSSIGNIVAVRYSRESCEGALA